MAEFHVKTGEGGEVQGPFSSGQLKELAEQGMLEPKHLVSSDKGATWNAASRFPALEFQEPELQLSPTVPHRGTLLLVLSICGWLVCAILSPITWLMARGDLKQMDEGLMDPSGADTTRAAKLIAMIHCIVCIVALVVGGLLFLFLAVGLAVTPNVVGASDEANEDTTRLNIKAFEQAAQMYKIKNKVWPEGATEDVVMLLMMTEDDRGQQQAAFLEKIPVDAWGEPLQYQYPADNTGNTGKPLIYSFGPDRDEGGNDNISNIDDLIEQGL